MTKKLLPLIPQHKIYVEPFAGGASLFFAKAPSKVEVLNDINGDIVNFYAVLRDKRSFKEFARLVELTPYSREEYYNCRDSIALEKDNIERARMFFVLARQSFSGSATGAHGWSMGVAGHSHALKWLSAVNLLGFVHKRLIRAQIENKDFRFILETYDTEETFFYLDPPYVHSTRSDGEYEFEMTDDDHKELVEMLLKIKSKALLSGYDNEIYKPLEENGWNKIQWKTACYAAARTKQSGIIGKGSALKKSPRTETVWFNYTIQKNLFA